MAAPSSEVHTSRILSATVPTWQLFSERTTSTEETPRTEIREALSTLQDAGDLLGLSNGYWAPATARMVELPDEAGYLLIGGVPSAVLPIEQGGVQYHGPHRYFAKLSPELVTVLPMEDLASWARLPGIPLKDWAREVIDSHEPYPYSPLSSDVFEFYLPASATPATPQFKRWSDSAGGTTGTFLARRIRLYGAREYRLVEMRSGRIVAACELYNVDVRRLMYAFDSAAKNPVRVLRREIDGHTDWQFTSELPRSEQRTFAALGKLTIPDDRPFERRWVFVRHQEIALDRIRYLGIAVG